MGGGGLKGDFFQKKKKVAVSVMKVVDESAHRCDPIKGGARTKPILASLNLF